MDVYWQVTVVGNFVMILGAAAIRYSEPMGKAVASVWRRQSEVDPNLAQSSAKIVGYGACLIGVVAVFMSIVAPGSF